MQHILDVQIPDENPAGAPGGDFQHIDTNPNMFGGFGAKAEEQLGQGVEKAGNTAIEVATEQNQQQNKIQAADVKSWYADQTTDLHTKFTSLSGRAALDALPEYKQKLGELKNQALEQVPAPASKAMLNESLTTLQDQYYRYWAGHAGGQLKSYQDKVAQDSIASSSSLAVNSLLAGDELGFERRLREQDVEVHNLYDSQGYDPDAMSSEVAKRRGITLKTAIETTAASGDVGKAQALFDKYKDRMDPASVLQVTANLKSGVAQLNGRNIADEESGHTAPKADAVAGVPSSFVAQVKRTEGFAPAAKWDVKQFSSGYGTKAAFEGEQITKEEADRRFNVEFAKAANVVDSVNPNLDPGTKAALSSLTYNAGSDWVHSGLGEAVRAGDVDKAKQLFLQYNKAGGETNEGLVSRRYREAQWFGTADAPAGNGPLVPKQTAYERVLNRTDNNPLLQTAAMARLNQVYGIYHTEQATQNATFDQKLADTQAEAMANGTAKTPLSEPDFVNRYGATEGQQQYGEYQKNLALGSDIAGLATMSPDEMNTVLARHTPQAGSPGFEAEQTRQQAVAKAIQHTQKERDDDPAAFALRRLPAAQKAYADLNQVIGDKNASPDDQRAAAARFANVTLAEQARVGVPPAERSILTAAQVAGIGGAINTAATSDDPVARQNVIPLIKQQADLWGNNWPQVAQQILPNAAPIVKAIAAGADPDAMLRVLSIPKGEDPAKIVKEQNEVTSRNMENALNVAMAPFLNSMVGLQKDRDYKGYHDVAEKLAALYVRDGKGAEEAAQSAFDNIVGKRYTFADTYRIPKSPTIDADSVQRGAYEARQEIMRQSSAGVTPQQNFERNATFAKPSESGYATALQPEEETAFRSWVGQNKVPFDPNSKGPQDYDMRGFWKGLQSGDEHAKSAVDANDGKLHYPDFWKTPYHETFSNESQWANDKAPHWSDDDKLLAPDGAVMFDDRAPFRHIRMQINDIGISDNEGDSRRNYSRDGVFVTSPKNDGLNIAYKNTFVSGADGKPILLTWDQLQKMGGTKVARAADAARATAGTAQSP